MIAKYRKFIAAIVTAGAAGLAIFGLGDGATILGVPVDAVVAGVMLVLNPILVRQLPNER